MVATTAELDLFVLPIIPPLKCNTPVFSRLNTAHHQKNRFPARAKTTNRKFIGVSNRGTGDLLIYIRFKVKQPQFMVSLV